MHWLYRIFFLTLNNVSRRFSHCQQTEWLLCQYFWWKKTKDCSRILPGSNHLSQWPLWYISHGDCIERCHSLSFTTFPEHRYNSIGRFKILEIRKSYHVKWDTNQTDCARQQIICFQNRFFKQMKGLVLTFVLLCRFLNMFRLYNRTLCWHFQHSVYICHVPQDVWF